MKKYRASLKNTSEPNRLSQIDKKMDLRGLMKYAKNKGVKVAELYPQEKAAFVK